MNYKILLVGCVLTLSGCGKKTPTYYECIASFEGAPANISSICNKYIDRPIYDLFASLMAGVFLVCLTLIWVSPLFSLYNEKINTSSDHNTFSEGWDYTALFGTALFGFIALVFVRSFFGNDFSILLCILIALCPTCIYLFLSSKK